LPATWASDGQIGLLHRSQCVKGGFAGWAEIFVEWHTWLLQAYARSLIQ
jgi:hypothetical protein